MADWIRSAVIATVIARALGVACARVDAQMGTVRVPRKIKDATPEYPARSLQAGDEGVVLLELTIDTAGFVSDARVIWSTCQALDEAAVAAAKRWQFEVVRVNVNAVSYTLGSVEVPFRLPPRFKARAGRPGACKSTTPPRPIR